MVDNSLSHRAHGLCAASMFETSLKPLRKRLLSGVLFQVLKDVETHDNYNNNNESLDILII